MTDLLKEMLKVKQSTDNLLIMNREKYLYQMYLSDCKDRGLEPSNQGFFEWKRAEQYIEVLHG